MKVDISSINLYPKDTNGFYYKRKYYSNIKDKMNQAKEYMASSFKKINNDEAKYIFFWGLDTLFEDDKKRIEEAKSKKEAVK